MNQQTNALGLYIHIPFCEKKCPYCDFNTFAGLESLHARTVAALCVELEQWAPMLAGQAVTSVFVGGGTPTVLEADLIAQLMAQLHRHFELAPDCEVTSEANPGTVDRSRFHLLRELGFNRISLGVQSFQPDELKFLGRIHDVVDVHAAVAASRAAGFDNINLDFMFGLPGQSLASWESTLQQALALAPEHLSLYSLIVEPDTPLHHWVQIGRVAPPDEDEAAAHYELAQTMLANAGYRQYEVSNWARDDASGRTLPALACRHNLVYWRNEPYLGIGPGAHSHLTLPNEQNVLVERRWGNHKPVAGYVRRVMNQEPVAAFTEEIDPQLSMAETMMLGLRLVDEGVSLSGFAERYGRALTDVYAAPLARLNAWDLLDMDDERVRLSPRGLMVGNQVFTHFLPDDVYAEPELSH